MATLTRGSWFRASRSPPPTSALPPEMRLMVGGQVTGAWTALLLRRSRPRR